MPPAGWKKPNVKRGTGGKRTSKTNSPEIPEPPIDTRADLKPNVTNGAKERYQLSGFLDISPDQARALGAPVDELENMGIDYHRSLLWNGGSFWEQYAGYTPAAQWLDEREDRKLPLAKNGQPIKRKDAVLCIKSVDEVLEQIEAERQGLAQYNSVPNQGGNKTLAGPVPGLPKFDISKVTREMSEEAHDRHVAQGLIGPTAEMSYEEVFRRKGKARVDSEEAHYREGGFHVSKSRVPDEVNKRARDQYEESRDRAISGKSTFGGLTGGADKWTRNPVRGYRGQR